MARPLIWTALLLVLLAVACAGGDGADEPVEVTVTTASRGRVARTVRASARLEAGREALLFGSGRVTDCAVEEGDTVRAGQTLVSLSGDEAAAEAGRAARRRLEAAGLELENARADLQRAQRLHESGAVSRSELEGAETAVEAARAARDAARARLAAAEASAEASTVKAPFGGVVGRVWARRGMLAGDGPLVHMVGPEDLRCRLMLPRSYAGSIGPGAEATFRTSSAGLPELRGSVTEVSPGLDPQTGLLPVTVSFPDGSRAASGLVGTVSVVTRVEEDVLAVPREALRRTAECCRLVVVEAGMADVREVTTGLTGDQMVQIRSGLEGGEAVVTDAEAYPADGDSVRVSGD
jgi:RND family efflux transporter MFP subunit